MNKLTLILVFVFLIYGLFLSFLSNNRNNSDNIETLCFEYEIQGVIPENSCECAKKLFIKFSDSYDWMDACEILKKRKKNTYDRQ